ncbi:hypothetical protein V6N12_059476 [Hibiscus sabdariffa]|uniref:Uncharacterized protein n=1 Tax=Hibiscus sabdariffa TaxID=183260 RepID=A0ABR2EV72_9ROSI
MHLVMNNTGLVSPNYADHKLPVQSKSLKKHILLCTRTDTELRQKAQRQEVRRWVLMQTEGRRSGHGGWFSREAGHDEGW